VPQFGPPLAVAPSAVTVDAEGFALIPNDSSRRGFKVTEDPDIPGNYAIAVLDGTAKVIHYVTIDQPPVEAAYVLASSSIYISDPTWYVSS